MTIDRPIAVTDPSNGKFASDNTNLFKPMSIVPNLADKSPT